jgi:hypothetical protein
MEYQSCLARLVYHRGAGNLPRVVAEGSPTGAESYQTGLRVIEMAGGLLGGLAAQQTPGAASNQQPRQTDGADQPALASMLKM